MSDQNLPGPQTAHPEETPVFLGRSRALLFNFTHKDWDLRSLLLVHSSDSGFQLDLPQLV
jgi:hypothetical protein